MTKSLETKRRAFSLAEALVVMLIISIVTMISIPLVTKKRVLSTNAVHGRWACTYDNGSYYQANATTTDGALNNFQPVENCQFPTLSKSVKYLKVDVFGAGGGGTRGKATPWVAVNEHFGFGEEEAVTHSGDYDFDFFISSATDYWSTKGASETLMAKESYMTACQNSSKCSTDSQKNYYYNQIDSTSDKTGDEKQYILDLQSKCPADMTPSSGEPYYMNFKKVTYSDTGTESSPYTFYGCYALELDGSETRPDGSVTGDDDCNKIVETTGSEPTTKMCVDYTDKDTTGQNKLKNLWADGHATVYYCYGSYIDGGVLKTIPKPTGKLEKYYTSILKANSLGFQLNNTSGCGYHSRKNSCETYLKSKHDSAGCSDNVTDDNQSTELWKVSYWYQDKGCATFSSMPYGETEYASSPSKGIHLKGTLALEEGWFLSYERTDGYKVPDTMVGGYYMIGGKLHDILKIYLNFKDESGTYHKTELAKIYGGTVAWFADSCPSGHDCKEYSFVNIPGYTSATSSTTKSKFYMVQPNDTGKVKVDSPYNDNTNVDKYKIQIGDENSKTTNTVTSLGGKPLSIDAEEFDFKYGCPGDSPAASKTGYMTTNKANSYRFEIGMGGKGAKGLTDSNVVTEKATGGGVTYFEHIAVAGGAAGKAPGECSASGISTSSGGSKANGNGWKKYEGPTSAASVVTYYSSSLGRGGRGGGIIHSDNSTYAKDYKPFRIYSLSVNADTEPADRWSMLDAEDGTAGLIVVSW